MSKEPSRLVKLFDPQMWLYDFVKITGCIPALIDLRLKRIYENGKKPKGLYKGKYLVSGNHIGYTDPVILNAVFASRRLSFVATKEIFEVKFWGKFFEKVGCIKVDKENVSMKTFKTIKERLTRGHIVGVFPEGHVSDDGEMKGFKSGIVMMALMSEADIIPTLIIKRKKWWQRQCVVVGNKIKLSDYIKSPFPTMDELNNMATILHDKEKELEKVYFNYKNKKNGKNE